MTYQKMVEAAEAAGIRKIQEAVQADLNRWLKNRARNNKHDNQYP